MGNTGCEYGLTLLKPLFSRLALSLDGAEQQEKYIFLSLCPAVCHFVLGVRRLPVCPSNSVCGYTVSHRGHREHSSVIWP